MPAERTPHVRTAPRGRAQDALDDSVTLGRLERWALERVRRQGLRMFVIRMSLLAVVASAALTAVGLIPMGVYASPSDWIPALAMGFVIPALVAPPMLWFSLRLVVRLDVAAALLERSAVTDHLTGVFNRRGFFGALERIGGPTSAWRLAMIDVDDFKQLNDRHGHALGDAALREVARWLTGQLGDGGAAGRLGGDEFALVVPSAANPIPDHQRFEVEGIEFTVSIGQATGAPDEDTSVTLAAADERLYETKQARATALAASAAAETNAETADAARLLADRLRQDERAVVG